MRHRTMRWLALLAVALPVAACGGTTQAGGSPPPSATPTLPSAGTVSATISGLGPNRAASNGYELAADDTAVWVHNGQTGTLLRIDPKTNTLVATITVGAGDGGVALGQGAVWVVSSIE